MISESAWWWLAGAAFLFVLIGWIIDEERDARTKREMDRARRMLNELEDEETKLGH